MAKILWSPGYGGGWSTWGGSQDFMLKDPTLIELAERGADEAEVRAYIDSKFPDAHIFTGGWEDIRVADLPNGTKFRITEYDGAESIELMDEIEWSVA